MADRILILRLASSVVRAGWAAGSRGTWAEPYEGMGLEGWDIMKRKGGKERGAEPGYMYVCIDVCRRSREWEEKVDDLRHVMSVGNGR